MSEAASFKVIDGWDEMPADLLFTPALYNQKVYLGLKDFCKLKTFLALNDQAEVLCRIRFAKTNEDSHWVSLPAAPFGGLEVVEGFDVAPFLTYVISQFKNGERLFVRSAPSIYATYHQPLIEAGFNIAGKELNHHVELNTDFPIHVMEKRRLKKAVNAGCTFKKWHLDGLQRQEVYDFISKCRSQQDLEINITKPSFIEAVQKLASHYQAYVVELGGEIIAATVVVKVNAHIAYNYLPASDKAYNRLSPMVLLMRELYGKLRDDGFSILDWGMTSIDGEEQTSLARFKEAMGAKRSTKFHYEITL